MDTMCCHTVTHRRFCAVCAYKFALPLHGERCLTPCAVLCAEAANSLCHCSKQRVYGQPACITFGVENTTNGKVV